MTASDESLSFAKLGEANYQSWSKDMKAYLMKKRVWGIVKGVDVKPEPGASDLREWLKDEQLAAGTIYLGLEDGQKSHVDEYQDDPVKMWTELEAIHVQKRPTSRYNAYNALFSIQKDPDETLLKQEALLKGASNTLEFRLNQREEDVFN